MSFTTNAYNARKRWYPSNRPEYNPCSALFTVAESGPPFPDCSRWTKVLVPGLVRQSAIRCVDADLDRIVFLNHERLSRKIWCAAWETRHKGKRRLRSRWNSCPCLPLLWQQKGCSSRPLTRLRVCGCELIGQPLATAASCTEICIHTCQLSIPLNNKS